MHICLETDRLTLRRFTENDADNLIDLDGDPEVMHFLNGGRSTPPEAIRKELLPRYLEYYERSGGYGVWAAIEKSSGDFLGWFALRPKAGGSIDQVELGYRLRKSAWGKGYATEGSRALIRKGFTELGMRRVFAQTMSVNLASRRVMEKAGLTFVRTFFLEWPDVIEGSEHGDVEYALLKDDWERREAADYAQSTGKESATGF